MDATTVAVSILGAGATSAVVTAGYQRTERFRDRMLGAADDLVAAVGVLDEKASRARVTEARAADAEAAFAAADVAANEALDAVIANPAKLNPEGKDIEESARPLLTAMKAAALGSELAPLESGTEAETRLWRVHEELDRLRERRLPGDVEEALEAVAAAMPRLLVRRSEHAVALGHAYSQIYGCLSAVARITVLYSGRRGGAVVVQAANDLVTDAIRAVSGDARPGERDYLPFARAVDRVVRRWWWM